MKIIWSPLAVERMTDISDYIALDNQDASISWIELIFDDVDRLRKFPESGRVVPEINKSNIRELVHGNYRVIYKIGSEEIYILTIRHYRQILPIDEVT